MMQIQERRDDDQFVRASRSRDRQSLQNPMHRSISRSKSRSGRRRTRSQMAFTYQSEMEAHGHSQQQSMRNKTVLQLAENSRWKELKQRMQECPEECKETDDFGMTPLHWACTDSTIPTSVLQQLAHTYPDATLMKNSGGLLPLHIAIKAKFSLDMIKVLVKLNDKTVCEETNAGDTAAELAANLHLSSMIVIFLEQYEEDLREAGLAPPREPKNSNNALSTGSQRQHQPPVPALREHDEHEDEEGGPRHHQLQPQSSKGSSSPLVLLKPPKWKLDKKCFVCRAKFGYFKSRHHCRNCGGSVCNTHSNRRIYLRQFGFDEAQRVCIECYDRYRSEKRTSEQGSGRCSGEYGFESGFTYANVSSFRGRDSSSTVPTEPYQCPRYLNTPTSPLVYRGSASSKMSDKYSSGSEKSDPHSYDRQSTSSSNSDYTMTHSQQSAPSNHSVPNSPRTFKRYDSGKKQANTLEESRQGLARNNSSLSSRSLHSANEKTTEKQSSMNGSSHAVEEASGRSKFSGSFLQPKRTNTSPLLDDEVDIATTCNLLGQSYLEKGDFKTAIKEFKKASELREYDAEIWYNLGKAYYENHEFEEAEKVLKMALKLRPNFVSCLSLLGKVYHSENKEEAAISVYKDVLKVMNFEDSSDNENDIGSTTVGW